MNLPFKKFLSAAALGGGMACAAISASAATFAQNPGLIFGSIASTGEFLTLLDVTGTAGEVVDLAAVIAAATSGGGQIQNIYLGPNETAWTGFHVNFLPASSGRELAADGTASEALWLAVDADLFDGAFPADIEFGANTVSFAQFGSKFGGEDFFPVDAPGVIPLPAAGWLLLTALGGLVYAGRRRKAV